MIQFIQNINGISLQHQNEIPLFEKTNIPPDFGDKLISRIYSDGSLYYLSIARDSDDSAISSGKWNFAATVTERGVKAIQEVLEKCCELESNTPKGGNIRGAVTWKIRCKSGIQELLIAGIPEGKYLVFTQIDLLINSNIKPFYSD
ncbi:MAG TPA: hypothetical protein DCR40_17080 [Prolixibacteraceae bacterium]|nr:hypothetical protein [Prolixibacteraceae bacterium]